MHLLNVIEADNQDDKYSERQINMQIWSHYSILWKVKKNQHSNSLYIYIERALNSQTLANASRQHVQYALLRDDTRIVNDKITVKQHFHRLLSKVFFISVIWNGGDRLWNRTSLLSSNVHIKCFKHCRFVLCSNEIIIN